MPTLRKLLLKFSLEERKTLEFLIQKIISLDWHGFNIKKLKGYQDIFRLRKSKIRIIFRKHKTSIYIVNIKRRNEKTYRF